MNYPLLQRMLKVAGADGPTSPAAIDVDRNETEWRFTPAGRGPPATTGWSSTHRLEDLAGNKIGQPFDIDVFDKVTEHIATTTTSIPFEIRAAR